jgi:hypothetical protein
MNMKEVSLFVDHEEIQLNANGVWLSNGEAITHEATLRAFAKNLHREGDQYVIRIGNNEKEVTVEDTPYFVVSLQELPGGEFLLGLNDETEEKLDPKTLCYEVNRLTSRIKRTTAFPRGQEAKFVRKTYFQILKNLIEESDGFYLKAGGERFLLEKK